jgi:hypothetical protein
MGFRPPASGGSSSGFAEEGGLTFSGTHTTNIGTETWHVVQATLTANHLDTIAGGARGKFVLYGIKQNGTGNWTFSITDSNNGPVALTLNPAPNSVTDILVYYRTSTDLDVIYLGGNAGGTVSDASTTVKGVAKLATAPASPTDPISVGDNDPRLPSQGENDALVGSSGTPGTGNKYVTDADPRNTNARTPTAHTHPVGDIGTGTPAAGKYVDGGTGAWTALPAGGGASFFKTPFRAGKTYIPVMPPPTGNITVNNTQALTVPFVAGRSCTITTVAVSCQVAGGAGAIGRIGIYTDNNGEPGTLVAEAATTLDLTSTGLKSATISAALTAEAIYWTVFVQQGNPTPLAQIKGTSNGGVNPMVPVDPTNPSTGAGLSITGGTMSGALPATAPGPWNAGASAVAVLMSAVA